MRRLLRSPALPVLIVLLVLGVFLLSRVRLSIGPAPTPTPTLPLPVFVSPPTTAPPSPTGPPPTIAPAEVTAVAQLAEAASIDVVSGPTREAAVAIAPDIVVVPVARATGTVEADRPGG